MSNVQLTVSKTFYSQILMHSCTQKMMSVWLRNAKNICLRIICKHGVIDQVKYRKISTKIKFTEREYNVHYDADVAHKDFKL